MKGAGFIAGLVLLAVTSTTVAQADDDYKCHLAFGVSATSQDFKDERFSGDSDDSSTGYTVDFAYWFLPIFAVELGYADLGDTDFDGSFEFMGGPPTSDIGTIESEAWTASALYKSKGRVAFLGRVGIAAFDVDEDEIFGGTPESNSSSGTSLLAGVGVEFKLAGRLSLRGELRRYFDVGEKDKTGEGDLDTGTVALVIGF